jgi:hypothetical protein
MTRFRLAALAAVAAALAGGTAAAGPLLAKRAPMPADADPAVALADSLCAGEARRLGRGATLQLASSGNDVQLAQAKAVLDPADDADLFEKLGLMEGHLLIGKALADAGMMGDALPHFGHPIEEIYDYIKPAFAARGVPEFALELKDLEAQMKRTASAEATAAKDDLASNAYVLALVRIDALRRSIPEATRTRPAFVLRMVGQMIDNAGDDLAESIERGRIRNRVEYHDAVGFARYAQALLKENAERLGKPGEEAEREIRKVMPAFAALKPPDRPSVSLATVQQAAARVKALAR